MTLSWRTERDAGQSSSVLRLGRMPEAARLLPARASVAVRLGRGPDLPVSRLRLRPRSPGSARRPTGRSTAEACPSPCLVRSRSARGAGRASSQLPALPLGWCPMIEDRSRVPVTVRAADGAAAGGDPDSVDVSVPVVAPAVVSGMLKVTVSASVVQVDRCRWPASASWPGTGDTAGDGNDADGHGDRGRGHEHLANHIGCSLFPPCRHGLEVRRRTPPDVCHHRTRQPPRASGRSYNVRDLPTVTTGVDGSRVACAHSVPSNRRPPTAPALRTGPVSPLALVSPGLVSVQ